MIQLCNDCHNIWIKEDDISEEEFQKQKLTTLKVSDNKTLDSFFVYKDFGDPNIDEGYSWRIQYTYPNSETINYVFMSRGLFRSESEARLSVENFEFDYPSNSRVTSFISFQKKNPLK